MYNVQLIPYVFNIGILWCKQPLKDYTFPWFAKCDPGLVGGGSKNCFKDCFEQPKLEFDKF